MFDADTLRRFRKAAALMVALPLVLAAPAAASAGQQTVADLTAPASQAVAAAEAVDVSCGVLPPKCTARLNRAQTRTARDAGAVAGVIAGVICAEVPGPGTPCTIALGGAATVLALSAGRFYEDGDCLGVEIMLAPVPLATPMRVKRGDHNCS